MTWARQERSLTRSQQQSLAARVIARDGGICYVCGLPGADEADHVVCLAEGGADDETNMAAIHSRPCHRTKTQQESARARWRTLRKRPEERHPGEL